MALQDAVSLETYVEALWITPAVVFSQLKYSWTEKIGEKWQKIALFYSIWSKNWPPGTSTTPRVSAIFRKTVRYFEFSLKAHESTLNLLRYMSAP